MKFEIPDSPDSSLPNDLAQNQDTGHNSKKRRRHQNGPTIPSGQFGRHKSKDHHPKHNHDLGHHGKSLRSSRGHKSGHKPIHDKNGMPIGRFDPLDHKYKDADDNPDGLRNSHHKSSPETKVEDGLGKLNPFGGKNSKHGISGKMNHLMNPLNKKIGNLSHTIDHDAKNAGSGASGMMNHAKNGLRRGKMLGMMALRHVGHGIGHIGAMVSGMLHGMGGAFGSAFGTVGSAVGISAHAVGAVAVVGVASMSIIGASSFFSSHDMESIGCAVQQVSDDSVSDTISGTAGGEWTQKGTKLYNLAKQIFACAKKLGFNDNGAAGVVGCAENEGAGDLNQDAKLNFGETDNSGDGGMGLYQFTPGQAGGGTLEAYEAWCKKNGHTPWESVMVETEGIMAVKQYSRSKTPSSPAEGAENWYLGCEDAAGWAGNAYPRVTDAEKAYSMFKGVGGESASNNDAAASNSSGNSACMGGSGDNSGSSNSAAVNYAEKYLGLPYDELPWRNQGAEDIGNAVPKDKCKPTDCAGFTWGIFKHLGYQVTSIPWSTNEDTFSPNKHVSGSQADAGTILDETDNGDPHTVLLREKWQGKATKVIDEDGGPALGHDVGNNTYGTAFYGCYGTPIFLQPTKK